MSNEYDDLIRQDKETGLRSALMASGTANPDQEAALQKLAARTGVPLDAVRLKKPEIELQDKLNSFDYEKVIKDSPKLSEWLADPKNAALAHDDWETLSGIEKTFQYGKDYTGAFGGGIVGDTAGRTLSGLGELYGVAVRSLDRASAAVMPEAVTNALRTPIPWWLSPESILKRPGAILKQAGDAMKPAQERQTLGTDVAGGIGQIGGQIAVFLATGGTVTTATMMAQGADVMADKTAKDIADPALKDAAILAGGAITAITEKYGLDNILNRVPPEVKNRTLRFIADKLAAGGIEAAQEFSEGLLHDIARRTLTNKDAELLQGMDREMTAAGLSAAIVRTALGVKGHARATQQEQFVKALTDQAANSKLRERMPEAFRNYLDQVTKDGPVENVFIPADQFSEYFQSVGLDPAVEASRLGVQNFAEAALAGGDVVIPTSEFVTQLSGSDHLQGLWNDLRFNQGDMTLREARQFEQERGEQDIDEETLQRMTGAVPESTGFSAVKEQIMGEMVGRFDQATAESYATQYASVIATMAERAGIDPLELANTYQMAVNMPIPDALKKALDKVDIDLDPIIDRLRAGDVPTLERAYGASLYEFIRDAGGLRSVGEVRDLDESISRKPGQKKLVQPDGMALDDALQLAIEAGYFPGVNTDELIESDLLDALHDDVGGSRRYSYHNENDRSVQELRILEGLQEYLQTIGADLNTMSNAEIKAKMRAEAEQAVEDVYAQITPDQARALNYETKLPDDPLFAEAVANTPGAQITEDGLLINLVRFQKEVQEGAQAIRTGVFYLPSGSANAKHYKTGKTGYGGTEKFEGETLLRRPLFVKGATGGKVPEAAYDAIKGKGAIKQLESDIFAAMGGAYGSRRMEALPRIEELLDQYGADSTMGYDIIENSKEGNQLRYALQENIIANAVREAGYDAVLGHSKGKAGVSISEVFDVREQTFPARGMESEVHSLYYQNTGDKRGSITIGANRKMTISLFEKANQSTFLHETGHFYLEVMGDLAERADAPQQIKDDYAAILKWMGITNRSEIEVKHHEMFARANEAYLMEGKAPSPELRGAFQNFKYWLLRIYETVKNLNVELSPELRGIFDRMYATDAQIEAAQSEAEFDALFATAADAGMSEAEFQAYTNATRQAIERGKEQLQTKLMRELHREKTREWKDKRAAMREEVAAEVDAEPVQVAFKALKNGVTDDGIPVKLSRRDLVRAYGEPFLKTLPRGFHRIYTKDGGVDLDTAAEMFGFDSGRGMVEALVNMQPRDALIDHVTDTRMKEQYGDIRFDGTIAEEAIKALHNDQRENVLKIELRAIRKKAAEVKPFVQAERARVREENAAERAEQQAGEQFVRDALPSREQTGRTRDGRAYTFQAFDPEPMKRAAAGMIGQKQIRDVRPQSYLLAERNAAKLGAKAMKEGDYLTAAEQKQRELFNHYLYREATRVVEEVESKAQWLAEHGKDKKRQALGRAGADYLEQVDDILERYEFKKVPLNKLAKRESLAAWVDQQEALGNAVSVPEDVLNEARRVNWKQIPVDELRAVHDSVKNIVHLAGLKNDLIVKGKRRAFEDMREELLDAIYTAPLSSTGELNLPNMAGASLKQKGAKAWRNYDAAHIKVEQLVAWLDNGDINGAWARNFFDLADGAQTLEYDLHRKVTKAIDDLRQQMPKDWQGGLFDKVDFDLPLVTGQGTAAYAKPTRYTLLSIALNMGNAQNIQRLQDGNRFTDAQLQQVRDALTDDDLRFVQGVWDAVELLWPEMAALEKRASGLAPEKVEAASFEVRGQVYRGGYFPLVYDSRISTAGEKQVEGDRSVEAFVASGFGRPTTNKGATKKRMAQVKQPVLLDMNEVIGGHIAKVVKDISHREAVQGLHRILTDGEIKTALIDRLGEAYYRELRDWTKVLVNDRSDSMNAAKGAARLAMVARTNLAIVTMGWKISTMMSQFAGFGPAMDLVKPGYLGRALLQAGNSPRETWAMIAEKSGEMRNRVQTIDRDVRDSMRRIADKRSLVADVQRSAFFLTAYADRMVTVPTWLGAYNQAIAEGQTEEAAIRAGDRAVRLSQGGGGAKDLAAVQRNNELMKLMTMYYTPFSALYARLRDVGHQQAVQGIGYLPKAVARLTALVLLPAVLGDLLAGRGPDDDEDEVWWAVRKSLLYPVAALPAVRDFAGLMEQKIIALSGEGEMNFAPSYNISPIVSAIGKAYKNLISKPIDVLAGQDEFDAEMLGAAFESSGLVLGLPTAQTRITGGYLYDLMTGEAEPENAPELLRDLLFKRKKE